VTSPARPSSLGRYARGVQEGPTYEVRCPRCDTSFAPETRRCLHCGGPVGKGRIFASLTGEEQAGRAEDAPEADLARGLRNPLWVLTVILAVAISVARTCAEQG
jgi:ribosomal protein L37E